MRYNLYNIKSAKLSDSSRHPKDCGIGDEMQHITNGNTAVQNGREKGHFGGCKGNTAERRAKKA